MTPSRWITTTALVLALTGLTPAQTRVTTPVEALGFEAGADYHLATFEQAILDRLAIPFARLTNDDVREGGPAACSSATTCRAGSPSTSSTCRSRTSWMA